MSVADSGLIPLAEARALLGRATDKCEALKQSGTFIVVDRSGAPVSAVRMDGSPPAALPLVRAKAFAAAANGEPSQRFAMRMAKFGAGVFAAYQSVLRDHPFPGAGAVPVKRNGQIIGAISTGLGIGPFVKLPGVEPSELIADGKPANLEDIVISYAVGGPYSPQHGDDMGRWIDAYGSPPDPLLKGSAMAAAPIASRQTRLSRGREISNHAMALAAEHDVAIAVVIVDAAADTITMDRMDSASPMGVDIASAVAVAAVNFAVPTADIAALPHYSAALGRLMELVPYRMLAVPGGHPLGVGAQGAGAIGIYCHDLDLAQRLAQVTAEWSMSHFKGDHQ